MDMGAIGGLAELVYVVITTPIFFYYFGLMQRAGVVAQLKAMAKARKEHKPFTGDLDEWSRQ